MGVESIITQSDCLNIAKALQAPVEGRASFSKAVKELEALQARRSWQQQNWKESVIV
jgi:hypothetical protein